MVVVESLKTMSAIWFYNLMFCWRFYILLLFATTLLCYVHGCPPVCVCQDTAVDCSGRNLNELPTNLPKQTSRLDLSSNKFVELPDISKLLHLNVLILSRNSIQNLNISRMSNTSLLKELDFSYNNITDISAFSASFPVLEKLSLQHNRINSLDVIGDNRMPKLSILRVGHNEIELLVSPLDKNWENSAYPSLQTIELNNNKISAISMFLTRFRALKRLVLSHNSLQSLDGSSFLRNDDLEELYLDHNQLSRVTNMWFAFKEKLSSLDLSYNHIHQIDQRAFQSAVNVKYIDLSSNNLQSLDTGMLYQLRNLSYLNLHSNDINYVSDHAFYGLEMLLYLNMSNNKISIGQKEFDTAFKPLPMLKILDLDWNNILLIPANSFLGLSSLQILYMKHNAIEIVEKEAFIHLINIRSLYVDTNQLLCGCSIGWLRNWIKRKSLQNTIAAVCSSPRWLENKNIMNVLDTELVCGGEESKYTYRPKVALHPQSKYAFLHGNTTLSCMATSSTDSEINIFWYKSSKLVDPRKSTISDQMQVGLYGYKRVATLTLKSLSFDDGGDYWCHVSNIYGSDWSVAANLSIAVAPTLSQALRRDLIARSGEDIHIPCSGDGIPTPHIYFTKENSRLPFHAVVEKRIVYNNQQFGIERLKIEDSGVYSCTARSPVGIANATIRLTVMEKPKFIRPMKDKFLVAGATAVIDCIISGNPRPKITWYKDNVLLQSSSRIKLSNQLLVLANFQHSDEAMYECQASNRLGTVRQKAHLTVGSTDGDSSSGLPSEVFVTVIVITVVAVTVLTSLVWLALICYCRKRRRERERKINTHQFGDSLLSELPKDYVLRCNGRLVSAQEQDDLQALNITSESLLLQTREYLREQQDEDNFSDLDEDDSGVALVFPHFENNHPEAVKTQNFHPKKHSRRLITKPAVPLKSKTVNCPDSTSTLKPLRPNRPGSNNNSTTEFNKYNPSRLKLIDYDPVRLKTSKHSRTRHFSPDSTHDGYFQSYITSSSGIESGGSSSSSETLSLTNDEVLAV